MPDSAGIRDIMQKMKKFSQKNLEVIKKSVSLQPVSEKRKFIDLLGIDNEVKRNFFVGTVEIRGVKRREEGVYLSK